MPSDNRTLPAPRPLDPRCRQGVTACLLLAALFAGGCALHHARPREDVPAVLLAAFLYTRPLLGPGAGVVVDPYQHNPDTVPPLWTDRDLRLILADTSVRLGDATARRRTLAGRPFPSSPRAHEVRVSFSVPEFHKDTARVLVGVFAQLQESGSRALDRLTLVRRRGAWTVVRREQLLIS
ncbi:MAG: hypothetical protein M3303_05935 [Gemmatimonadota bacterium]|nr:hypothetical protein [Gemmatimonadota bacterium]